MNAQELFKLAEELRNKEKWDEAITTYYQARDLGFKENNLWMSYESLHMVGLLYQQKGDLSQAEKALVQAQQEMEDWVAMVLRDRARVALEGKDIERADDLVRQSIKLLSNSKQKGHLGISQVQLAKVLSARGDFAGAEQVILDAIKLIKQSENSFFESTAYFNLGLIQKEEGKTEDAKQSIQSSLEILDSITTPEQHKQLKVKRRKLLEELN